MAKPSNDPVRASRSRAINILTEMLALPTAPFAEHLVAAFIERFCERRKPVTLRRDAAGNLLVRIRIGRRHVARPVCITAHLDHPGFVSDRMIRKGRLRAFWRGGVPTEYFVGSSMRFWVENRWLRGEVKSVKTVKRFGRTRVDTADIAMAQDVPSGSIGMWDLPDPQISGSRIYARSCDDIIGASAMLAAIDHLVRRNLTCDAYFLFTRAEEVGFIGAMAACRLGTIPKKCYVVAMEASSELPHARMGDGPILRVGDKASTFTPTVTAHCQRIAHGLVKAKKRFRFQRRLMDGGTCESSAYCLLGYEATGVCLALGNYHNVDHERKAIRPEYIDLNDYEQVVSWFVELARARYPYTGRDDELRKQIRDLDRAYRKLLRETIAES